MEQKNERRKEKNVILIFLILIVLIIITFLLIQFLAKIDNNEKIPTGNVDIFDITFAYANSSDGQVIVEDAESIFSTNTPIRIFTHSSYYIANDLIAPESQNSYQFVIRNNNDFKIKYNFDVQEENKYNINMKFRLKLNGVYVVGSNDEYVTADELFQYDMILADNNYDVYTLDWKWFEGPNDTEIGTNINSKYKLSLDIAARQY